MTRVYADLVGDICRCLEPNSDWQMELLDEAGKALFRITLVGETLP
jgi:hypothetical protein